MWQRLSKEIHKVVAATRHLHFVRDLVRVVVVGGEGIHEIKETHFTLRFSASSIISANIFEAIYKSDTIT
jgi:hypothetical protein